MPTYCEYILAHPEDTVHRVYHDTAYGFPLDDDNALFERFMLEINQAGLSWTTILKKADNFHRAYHHFEIARVASYQQRDMDRLLSDAGIIRNRLKVKAAIENARRIRDLQREHGSFKAWLDAHHPSTLDDWKRLFKATFTFTGGEIVREFLVSTGYLRGAHEQSCPVYAKIMKLGPPWAIIKKVGRPSPHSKPSRRKT